MEASKYRIQSRFGPYLRVAGHRALCTRFLRSVLRRPLESSTCKLRLTACSSVAPLHLLTLCRTWHALRSHISTSAISSTRAVRTEVRESTVAALKPSRLNFKYTGRGRSLSDWPAPGRVRSVGRLRCKRRYPRAWHRPGTPLCTPRLGVRACRCQCQGPCQWDRRAPAPASLSVIRLSAARQRARVTRSPAAPARSRFFGLGRRAEQEPGSQSQFGPQVRSSDGHMPLRAHSRSGTVPSPAPRPNLPLTFSPPQLKVQVDGRHRSATRLPLLKAKYAARQ